MTTHNNGNTLSATMTVHLEAGTHEEGNTYGSDGSNQVCVP